MRGVAKRTRVLRHIPIFAVSAHAMTGDEACGRECGCDDYISTWIQPVDEDVLFAKLKLLLKSQ
jgi:CheY-like chemotaxis protein